MLKVIIAGGRKFKFYVHLCHAADNALKGTTDSIEIVSGRAHGADRLGEKYAEERGYAVKLFPANWEKYGKGAGHRRNAEMANYADVLFAFWDGKSKGTKSMIDLAQKKGLNVRIFEYES